MLAFLLYSTYMHTAHTAENVHLKRKAARPRSGVLLVFGLKKIRGTLGLIHCQSEVFSF